MTGSQSYEPDGYTLLTGARSSATWAYFLGVKPACTAFHEGESNVTLEVHEHTSSLLSFYI